MILILTIPFIISTILISNENKDLKRIISSYNSEKEGIINGYEIEIEELNEIINNLENELKNNKELSSETETNLNQEIKELTAELEVKENLISQIQAPYDELHITTQSRLNPDSSSAADYTYTSTMDLRTPASCTVYEIDSFLQGTGMEGLGQYYIDAQRNYGVNAIFLMCKDIIESGWGESQIATDKNNLSGYNAIDENPYYYATTFESKAECIDTVSKSISENYLSENGKFFRGYDLYAINEIYAQNGTTLWVETIANQMCTFDKYCINLQQLSEE
jgi:beta-N-acetylglucosaminidase